MKSSPRDTPYGRYVKAAQRVESGKNVWSCCAIAGVPDHRAPECEAVTEYERLFMPTGAGPFWGHLWDYEDAGKTHSAWPITEDGKNCRVLALCFMAAIQGDR